MAEVQPIPPSKPPESIRPTTAKQDLNAKAAQILLFAQNLEKILIAMNQAKHS